MRRIIAMAVALSVALGTVGLLPGTAATVALAEGTSSQELQRQADELMADVREKVAAYNDALSRAEDLQARVAQTEEDISRIEGDLPARRERAARSIKSLYRMSQDDSGLVALILCSDDFESLVTSLRYLDSVAAYNTEQVQALVTARDDLETAKATLEAQRQQAQQEAQAASQALGEAQAAAERAQAAADAARALEAARVGSGGFTSAASSEEAIATTDALAEEAGVAVAGDDSDDAQGREAFVEKWAPRIDAYLAGRPLQGQGRAFAEAAFDQCLDPRWSPATSMVESGGGAACFASYNAYGWLARGGFSSWEEGVREHAAYLRGTYGTSPTPAAAGLYLVGDPTALAESNEYYLALLTEMAKV